MTIKQANVTINVRDMDAAVSFYQSIGLAVQNRWGNYYAQLTAIAITERSEEGGQFLHFTDPDGTALYFIKPKWG